jgi:phosphate transport system permease protein
VKRKRRFESVIERSLLFSASISVISVAFITFFIFMQGLPLFAKVNPLEFIFSMRWEPSSKTNPGFGILSFIVGSLYVTLGALLIAVPVGVACGIFLAELATGRLRDLLRTVVELLAGIPSVIYGLFGIVFICGMVREVFGGNGYSVLSASIILAIMTLPTIINITEVSIRMVPREYYEGSLALGATHWQTIVRVLLPAARSGIIAGIVLGMGRSIGETMAVLLVGGNAPIMPDGPLSMVRTLTMNIITDMSYASGDHMTALFSTSMVLFIFILVLNLSVQFFLKRSIEATAGNG